MSSDYPVKKILLWWCKQERKVKFMDLTDQTMSGSNEICLTDSLNASLLKLKVKMDVNTVVPSSNDLIIYVDRVSSSDNPTADRKQYVFNLTSPLKYYDQIGDELIEQININDNDVILEAFVNRYVETSESGDYVLEEVEREDVDSVPIILFEGVNYIYTNYSNAIITLIYPKDNELNKIFLNNAIYTEYKENSVDEISLDDLYFKDAFTKTEDNLNLEINNVSIDCLTSRNNKFSLDEEGNLTVNSINSVGGGLINNQTICDLIYPVGSIYLSINSTSPDTLFGGTWERINGYYLYAGTGGTTAGNNTSGEPSTNTTGSTVLTIDQMPSHTHTQNAHNHTQNNNTWMNDPSHYDTRPSGSSGYYSGAGLATYYTGSTTATNNYTGGGQGHTHTLSSHTHLVVPLRYEVCMWKRTA